MSTNGKPLSASLGEALASKSPEVATLLSRPSEPARLSPPSSRPSRIADYRSAPPANLHTLRPPNEPDRSLVDSSAPPRARKKRVHLEAAQKAEAVRRALGGEAHATIAADFGVSRSAVRIFVRQAKERAAIETRGKFEATDIQRLSAELAEALNLQRAAAERVRVLKARLRELLGDED